MSEKQIDLRKLRHFALEEVFQDAHAVFGLKPKSLQELKGDSIVVLDTSALVAPYSLSSRAVAEVKKTLESLIANDRLIVPGRAAREFPKARIHRLANLIQKLNDLKSVPKSITTDRYSMLSELEEYQSMMAAMKAANTQIEQFKSSLEKLVLTINSWEASDPIYDFYRQIFTRDVLIDEAIPYGQMIQDLEWRQSEKIPPGYKDASKPDGGIGDLLIWRTLLDVAAQRSANVVFVSEDRKADWWHQGGGGALFMRAELVEEFRRETAGKTLHMVRFADFLGLFGVEEALVDEVRQEVATGHSANAEYLDGGLNRKATMIADLIEFQNLEPGVRMQVFDGRIYLFRFRGFYGAFKPVTQFVDPEGVGSIRYESWFIADMSDNFDGPRVEYLGGSSSEEGSGNAAICAGPLSIRWSGWRPGCGYVYFDTTDREGQEFEFAPTDRTVIQGTRGSRYNFVRRT
jgi:hypothetical protein